MDLLDWFFSFSTAHNFNFSNEVTLTLAFETITLHKFLQETRSRGANPFTLHFLLLVSLVGCVLLFLDFGATGLVVLLPILLPLGPA
jgi:hypothetical protein